VSARTGSTGLALCLMMCLASPAHAAAPAGDAQGLFAEANQKYFDGDWSGATTLYASIIERFEVEDAALYHNLGNACFRSGAYGSAILYYERALRLEPGGKVKEALEQNLDAARRTLQARYRASSDATLVYGDPSGVLYQVTHLAGETALALTLGALWLGFLALLALRRLRATARWPATSASPRSSPATTRTSRWSR